MNEGRWGGASVWARTPVRVCARVPARIRGHECRLIKLQRESIALLYLNFDNATPLELNNYVGLGDARVTHALTRALASVHRVITRQPTHNAISRFLIEWRTKNTRAHTHAPTPIWLLRGEIVSLMQQRVVSSCIPGTCRIPLLGPSSHLLPSRASPHVNSSHVYTQERKKVTA